MVTAAVAAGRDDPGNPHTVRHEDTGGALTVLHDPAPGDAQRPFTEALRGRLIAIVGYGNQGRAHALTLRDSGMQVMIAGRAGSTATARARSEGFEVHSTADAAATADLVVVATPDAVHGDLCREQVLPSLRHGAVLGFLHGYSIRFGLVEPSPAIGVILVAPKGPGATLRQRFLEGLGIPCLMAVHQPGRDALAEPFALAWASGLGCGRAGIVRTTFAEEAESDLFGEQAILCGGAMELARAAFQTLVEAGYPPELAYVECVHELKQVVDLLFERGFAGMYEAISETAEFGAYRAGPVVIDEAVRQRLRSLLAEIQDGGFARAMEADRRNGGSWFAAQRRRAVEDPIERAGVAVRSWMPWMKQVNPAHATEEPHP